MQSAIGKKFLTIKIYMHTCAYHVYILFMHVLVCEGIHTYLGGRRLENHIFWYCWSPFLITKASPFTTSATFPEKLEDPWGTGVNWWPVQILNCFSLAALYTLKNTYKHVYNVFNSHNAYCQAMFIIIPARVVKY